MQALLDAGADRVSLADTVGYADPRMVRDLFEQALRIAGDRFCCGHFHDTRGLAMANVYAALEVGVARFDASLAEIADRVGKAADETLCVEQRKGGSNVRPDRLRADLSRGDG